MEDKILGAKISLEYELFLEIRNETITYLSQLKANADVLSQIDVLSGLAEVASRIIIAGSLLTEDLTIEISNGRHPVEQTLDWDQFVPNDAYLDHGEKK